MLAFDELSHTYRWKGLVVPSVTQVLEILDGALMQIPLHVLTYARALGSAVHRATELDDQGLLDERTVAIQVQPYLEAWRKFRRDKKFAPTAMEQRVFHPKLHYAGTFDRIGLMGSKPTLLDIKSGEVWPSHGPQTAAYAAAYHATALDKLEQRVVVQLRDDGQYRVHYMEDSSDWGTFLACLTIHKFKARNSCR